MAETWELGGLVAPPPYCSSNTLGILESHQGRRMDVSENVRLTVMNGYWHLGHKSSTFVGETKNATQKNATIQGTQ